MIHITLLTRGENDTIHIICSWCENPLLLLTPLPAGRRLDSPRRRQPSPSEKAALAGRAGRGPHLPLDVPQLPAEV